MTKTKTKICASCDINQPLKFFSKRKDSPDGYFYSCKDCMNIRRKERRRKNPERAKHLSLQRDFGISLDKYKDMLLNQNGVCAICGKPETSTYKGKLRHLSVDHNHKTEKVRGLLCNDCNIALGWFHDDITVLMNAVEYLT